MIAIDVSLDLFDSCVSILIYNCFANLKDCNQMELKHEKYFLVLFYDEEGKTVSRVNVVGD